MIFCGITPWERVLVLMRGRYPDVTFPGTHLVHDKSVANKFGLHETAPHIATTDRHTSPPSQLRVVENTADLASRCWTFWRPITTSLDR